MKPSLELISATYARQREVVVITAPVLPHGRRIAHGEVAGRPLRSTHTNSGSIL